MSKFISKKKLIKKIQSEDFRFLFVNKTLSQADKNRDRLCKYIEMYNRNNKDKDIYDF